MDKRICIVSPHEKGFWQADVYLDGWEDGVEPDWFATQEFKFNLMGQLTTSLYLTQHHK